MEWTEKIAENCPYEYVYPAFLEHITPIGIQPEQVRGRVLVMGQASAFPEKTLIATPKSFFKNLRRGVEAVYCCDTTYPSSPEDHLNIPCVNTISSRRLPNPKQNTAYWELSSSYYFLPKARNDFFDVALMFRLVDLGTQIQNQNLVESLAPHLKKGGYFIASGGGFPKTPDADFFKPLNLVRSVRLPDFSDGFPFTENRGIILQK